MHHAKVNKGNAVGGRNLLDHDKRAPGQERARSNENIDPERTHLNVDYSARVMGPSEAWDYACAVAQEHAKGGRKMRDNAVVLAEDIVHLPDNWEQVTGGKPASEFFERVALPFLRGRYGAGDESAPWNEVSAVVHYDETRPHLHYKSVPIDKDGNTNHKGVYDRAELQRVHPALAAFAESRGYVGLHLHDETRARKREKALDMPEYKEAMQVVGDMQRRGQQKAAEAARSAETAEKAREDAERAERAAEAARAELSEVEAERGKVEAERGDAERERDALLAEVEQLRQEREEESERLESVRRSREEASRRREEASRRVERLEAIAADVREFENAGRRDKGAILDRINSRCDALRSEIEARVRALGERVRELRERLTPPEPVMSRQTKRMAVPTARKLQAAPQTVSGDIGRSQAAAAVWRGAESRDSRGRSR